MEHLLFYQLTKSIDGFQLSHITRVTWISTLLESKYVSSYELVANSFHRVDRPINVATFIAGTGIRNLNATHPVTHPFSDQALGCFTW